MSQRNIYRLCSASRVANNDKSIPECDCTVDCPSCVSENNNFSKCSHIYSRTVKFTFKCTTLAKLAKCKYRNSIFAFNPNLLTTMIQLGYLNGIKEYKGCKKKLTIGRLQLTACFTENTPEYFVSKIIKLMLDIVVNTPTADERVFLFICMYDFLFRNAYIIRKSTKFKDAMVERIHNFLETQQSISSMENVLKKMGTSVYDLFIENWLPQLMCI